MNETAVCLRQVERFFQMMNQFTPDSRRAFQKIYRLAPSGNSLIARGRHVRLAMMEAVRHPQIAYWVRVNLAVRVGLKFARVTGRQVQIQRLTAVLEAFHIAADAFVLNLSMEDAMQRRLKQAAMRRGKILPLPRLTDAVGEWISADELSRIQTFKQTIIPGFIGAVRQRQQIAQGGD